MQPLQFQPLLKRARWGGRRLESELHKQIGTQSDYAESWELVDHMHDQSIVLAGPQKGLSLKKLLQKHNQELLGRHAGLQQFPLLFKFLDANDTLSLQVHPNDEQAIAWNGTPNGKTEAWVIIQAEPESLLYAGIKNGVTKQQFKQALETGDVENLLHSFSVKPGNCIFIPAGTVHAIGAGVLLAEIQQASDITYRLYDWGKLGSDGKPREMHIEQGIHCIDWEKGPISPIVPLTIQAKEPIVEELVRCKQFTIQRHTFTVPCNLEKDHQCHVLMMLSGSVNILSDNYQIYLQAGDTLLIPATADSLTLVPNGELIMLDVTLPEPGKL